MRRWLARHRAPLVESAAGPHQEPLAGAAESFEKAMRRLGDGSERTRPFLAALAWAHGELPVELWAAMANALAGATVRPRLTESDAARVLRAHRSWITTGSAPDGRGTVRLRDQAIAAHLRAGADGSGGARAEAARRVTEALLASVPVSADGRRDWLAAGSYLRAHLAEHAAMAGPESLAALVTDPGFLPVADPARLIPVLAPLTFTDREIARAYRRARPLLGDDPHVNAAHLGEVGWGASGELGGLTAPVRPVYRTLLAGVRRDDSLLALAGHVGHLNDLAFGASPDGRLLLAAASDDGTIRMWDALSGEPLYAPITEHTDEVWSVAFGTAPDGGRLLLASAGKDATIRIWDPTTGAPVIDPITGHSERVYELDFGTAPDGRLLLASGSADKTARIWNPLTGEQIGPPLDGYHGRVRTNRFGRAPDGRLLLAAGSPDGPLRVWDALTAEPVITITGEAGRVFEVAMFPGADGRLVLMGGGVDQPNRFWDPVTGEPAGTPFPMLSGQLCTVAVIPGEGARDLMATSTGDRTIHVWDPRAGFQEVATLVSHAGMVQALHFATEPGGRRMLASCGGDRIVRIWDRLTSQPPPPRVPHVAWVNALAFGTDKTAGRNGAAGEGRGTAVTGEAEATRAGQVAGGRLLLASASDERRLTVWDPRTDEWVTEIAGVRGVLTSLAFGLDNRGRALLASASDDRANSDDSIRVWDPLTGALIAGPLRGHTGAVRAVAFGVGLDGTPLLASASDDETVRVWDPLTGDPAAKPVTAHHGGADALAFGHTGDGQPLLASGGGDHVVRLWDPLTGAAVGEPLTGHTGRVRSLAFGPVPKGAASAARGGLRLASASDDHTVRIWEPLARGRPHHALTLRGHTDWVASAAFGTMPSLRSGEGHRAPYGEQPVLVSGGGDRTVRLWDPATGVCLLTLGRESVVRALAMTGLTLAVGQQEGFSVLELDPASFQPRPG